MPTPAQHYPLPRVPGGDGRPFIRASRGIRWPAWPASFSGFRPGCGDEGYEERLTGLEEGGAVVTGGSADGRSGRSTAPNYTQAQNHPAPRSGVRQVPERVLPFEGAGGRS
jgi:hypothetical protein